MYSRNTELRHLAATDVYKLSQILEPVDSWRTLMATIPKTLTSPITRDAPRKYTSEQIRLIESASLKQNRTGTEILFDEWGTSGRNRPTIGNLLEVLIEAELFRAADHVAVKLLNETAPARPEKGPAAKITLPFDSEEIQEVDDIMQDVGYPESSLLIRNAKESSNMNNHDFYTKLGCDKEKFNVPVSDLMKFSSTSMGFGELPNISALGERSNENNETPLQITINSVHTQKILSVSQSGKNNSETQESDKNELNDSHNIPAISALQFHSSNSTISGIENSCELPNLSALNLNVNTNALTISTNTLTISSDSASNLDGRDANSETMNTYGSDNNVTPDLSILDQSSLDDSSLTNVTETSEDLSFDAGIRLNLSETNIPMLSILQK